MCVRRADHSSRGVLPSVALSECDREALIKRKPWPTGGCCAMGEEKETKLLLSLLSHYLAIQFNKQIFFYTGCNRRNGPDFGRVFLMLNYTEKPQNTYIQSSMFTEI